MSKDKLAEKAAERQIDAQTDGFGMAVVTWPDENKVYPSRFGNGKNTTVCTVWLPITVIGLKLAATIYARLEEKAEGTSITYEPSFSKGVKGISGDDLAYAKAHALDVATNHPGWAGAEAAAEKALTSPAGTIKAKGTKRELLPRLVKAVKVAKPAEQSAA